MTTEQEAYDSAIREAYPDGNVPTGQDPADRPKLTDAIMTGIARADRARLDYLTGVLDSITEEALVTKGSLRLGIAVAILTLDRVERGILTKAEGVEVIGLSTEAARLVCGTALLTRQCPQGHHWVTATTTARESFELPIVTEAHR